MKLEATKTREEEDFDEYSVEEMEKSLLAKYTVWQQELFWSLREKGEI